MATTDKAAEALLVAVSEERYNAASSLQVA